MLVDQSRWLEREMVSRLKARREALMYKWSADNSKPIGAGRAMEFNPYSQTAIANAIGLRHAYQVSKWESGASIPRLYIYDAWCAALGLVLEHEIADIRGSRKMVAA
jgi:hypothetical protein